MKRIKVFGLVVAAVTLVAAASAAGGDCDRSADALARAEDRHDRKIKLASETFERARAAYARDVEAAQRNFRHERDAALRSAKGCD